MNLELMAMRWLKTERSCMLVLCERSPRSFPCGKPDVLGVTAARYSIEVECKRSLSDFNADSKKFSRLNRDRYKKSFPKEFYYLMPAELAERVVVPEWAGLLKPNQWRASLVVLKQSPRNKESKRFTLKECVRLAHMISNNLICTEEKIDRFWGNHVSGPYEEYSI